MIKKYIEEKYKMEVTNSVIGNINRSIAYGAEKGTFVLPKGMLCGITMGVQWLIT